MKDIIPPGEIELYVRCIEPTDIEELGSLSWFGSHERIQKLHQQSILEAGELREEIVKEMLISYNKIPVLVHEIICISVWREKIFQKLLSIEPNPTNTFMAYIIMYHEGTIIGLLETILFHQDCCCSLDDCCIDLIDYCVFSIIRLSSLKNLSTSAADITKRNNAQELKHQKKELAFEIGLRCITIMRYLIENIDSLPLSATSRMFETHDVPLLLVNLTAETPWCKEAKDGSKLKYVDGNWQKVKEEDKMKLTRTEAAVWLALHQLLLNPKCQTHYDLNDYRKEQLLKLRGYLHEVLLDQLAPLAELQYWLSRLSMSQLPSSTKKPLILEVVPQIRESILNRSASEWNKIASKQVELLFYNTQEELMEIAKRLSSTYDPDTLANLATTAPTCSECGERAAKKCSRCKAVWYCGRECQVKNWPSHKMTCEKLVESLKKLNIE